MFTMILPQAHAHNICTRELEYTLSADGLEFNPSAGSVRMGRKELQLPRLHYDVLEHIVFGEKPFSHVDFDKVYSDLYGTEAKEVGATYLIAIVYRVQKALKNTFGKQISARLITIPSAGYVWVNEPDHASIPPGQYWFHPEKKYLNFGADYVHTSARTLSLLQALFENSCRPKTDTYLLAHLERNGFGMRNGEKKNLAYRQKIKNEIHRNLVAGTIIYFGDDQLALNPALFAGCKPWLLDN